MKSSLFALTISAALLSVSAGCRGSGGGDSDGPPLLVGRPYGLHGLFTDAASAVIGVIGSIDPTPRIVSSETTMRIDNQPARPESALFRGAISVERVMLASSACMESVIQRGDLDYRWLSQQALEYPRYVGSDGAVIPADRLPPGLTLKRLPEQTLVSGERALYFSGCPSARFCASSDCPNLLWWKFPILEGDVVDLSGLQRLDGVTPGPARIPVQEAVELIASDIRVALPYKGAVVLPTPSVVPAGSGPQ